ncbi:unnamed protein product [Dibothriocephalus latus]|uniref:Uncharacterized protein n=1 Tax=Dibothriocephalus latus TaxID=60516 RepID=A0A3P6QLD1_DIBLA|nr:unnamed protein product [Dibothriocephalus latus]
MNLLYEFEMACHAISVSTRLALPAAYKVLRQAANEEKIDQPTYSHNFKLRIDNDSLRYGKEEPGQLSETSVNTSIHSSEH